MQATTIPSKQRYDVQALAYEPNLAAPRDEDGAPQMEERWGSLKDHQRLSSRKASIALRKLQRRHRHVQFRIHPSPFG